MAKIKIIQSMENPKSLVKKKNQVILGVLYIMALSYIIISDAPKPQILDSK